MALVLYGTTFLLFYFCLYQNVLLKQPRPLSVRMVNGSKFARNIVSPSWGVRYVADTSSSATSDCLKQLRGQTRFWVSPWQTLATRGREIKPCQSRHVPLSTPGGWIKPIKCSDVTPGGLTWFTYIKSSLSSNLISSKETPCLLLARKACPPNQTLHYHYFRTY